MYIIRTTETGRLAPTHPLWWTGTEVIGVCRANEAAVYPTALAAAWALAGIKQSTVRFYQLEVAPLQRHAPSFSGHGWMVRHPGYDLMY